MRKIVHLAWIAIMLVTMQYAQGQSIPANSPAGINGKLSVIGNSLCNQYGKPIQLRGMSTHGLQWFYDDCYSGSKVAAFDALKNWGADVLRIAMYVQEDGYETDPTGFTNKVKALIDVASSRGMYALIDFHQLDPGDPNYNTARAKTFFAAIANQVKDYPNVIYDIANEPNGNSVTWAVIKNYADQVIPVIRAIDNDAVVLCGTHGWATFGLSRGDGINSAGGYKSVVNNKLNYPNVMYTFHFYADSHRDEYLDVLKAAANELPIFITEFGFQNSAGEGTNNRAMSDKYINFLREKKISWTNWNYSDDNRTGAVWKSGTCSSNNWSDANLKEAGVWVKAYISSPADDFPTDGGTNKVPTVSLTAPTNNASFNAPATINITANAADQDGTISKVEFFNGSTLLSTDNSSPYSFSWTSVPVGTYTITAKATDNQNASATSSAVTVTVINPTVPQGPYNGIVAQIPGTIQAENYDVGGQGVAYNDNTPTNLSGAYRTDAVDIEPNNRGDYNVDYVAADEWLEYTVNVTSAGAYNIAADLATMATGKSFRLELDGTVLGTFAPGNTGGWQNWQTVTLNNINLTAGQKILRIYSLATDMNIDKLVFTKVTVSNNPPTVSLTSPANNASFTAPANISIAANAADSDGSITQVQFFNGTTSLGTDNSAPYTFSWTNVATGTYTITAKATDNSGAVTTSAAVTVTVTSTPVTQSPYNGVAGTIPGTIQAENYDLGGQGIAYNDLTTANEGAAYRTSEAVDIEPISGGGFNVGWFLAGEWLEYTVNATAGTYKIEARVAAITAGKTFRIELDGSTIATITVPNTGGWGTFQTVTVNNVIVTGGQKILRVFAIGGDFNLDNLVFSTGGTAPVNQTPSVSLTAPANNATYNAPANISLSANATDPDGNGTISKVEFFNGATLLYTDNSAPYSFAWSNVGAGTYTVTAKVTDNEGASSTSSAVTVKVNTATTNGCSGIAQYAENNGYAPGSIVQNAGAKYQCKPFPYSGWCNGSAWAYAPGTGAYWQDAWTSSGSCAAREEAASQTATVNDQLLSNAPNPFTGSTTLEFTLAEAGEVSITVLDKTGQVIGTVVEGSLSSGTHRVDYDATQLNPGVYIIKCHTSTGVITRKIMKAQ